MLQFQLSCSSCGGLLMFLIVVTILLQPITPKTLQTADEAEDDKLSVLRGALGGQKVSNTISCAGGEVVKYIMWGNSQCQGNYTEYFCSGLCLPNELKPYEELYYKAENTPFNEIHMCYAATSAMKLVTLNCGAEYDAVTVEVSAATSCGCKLMKHEEYLDYLYPERENRWKYG